MWPAVGVGLGQAHLVEQAGNIPKLAAVELERTRQDLVDPVTRIERRIRMLEDDLHVAAVSGVHVAHAADLVLVEGDLAREACKPGKGAGHRRLARAGLADETEDLAATNLEPDLFCGRGRRVAEEPAAAILDFDLGGREKDLVARLVMDKATFRSGHGVYKCARVGMARSAEDVGRRRLLDQATALQNRDPVRDARHKRKIVGNVERGNARLPAQSREQFEDTRAGDDVECRGRLVEEDDVGLATKGSGNDNALLFPAGDLVRVAPHDRGRIVEIDVAKQIDSERVSAALLEAAVLDQGFRDLTTDGERRVQRGRGILKHHAEPAAAYPGELAWAQSLQVDVAETQRAGNFAGIARQMAHKRPGE